MRKVVYKSYMVTLKSYICLNQKYFRILCKSIGYIQSNEEISGEDEWDMGGREDHVLATKHRCSFNPMSHGKITSLWEKSQ